MQMTAALPTVLSMLLYALPGFFLIKSRLVGQEAIPSFAKLLMYVCQPALMIYSFLNLAFSADLLLQMLLALLILLVLQGGIMGVVALCFRKRREVRFRVYALACALGNCGFMGVPLLQALLPDYPQALAFSVTASVALNLLGWTAGSFILTRDKRHIRAVKLLANPAILAVAAAIPLFVCQIHLPALLTDTITMLGRMSTPLCMLIMGMRLAVCPAKEVFGRVGLYLTVGIKQILVPLLLLGVLRILPLDPVMENSLAIIACCPVASVVLNFSEMLGEGQQTAAGAVLLGTLLSVVTIPLITLLLT